MAQNMMKADIESIRQATAKLYDLLRAMDTTEGTIEALKYVESIFDVLKKSKQASVLKFASSNEALQYLANVTSSKVRIAGFDASSIEVYDNGGETADRIL